MPGMKDSTIRSVLRKKINEWLETVDNQELKEEIKENLIVTGGAIPSMLLNEKVNDYDFYFKTKGTTKKVAEYYVKVFNDKGGFK